MSTGESIKSEKGIPVKFDAVGDDGGRVLDIEQLPTDGEDVKTAPDGHTVLIPQPSADPEDPLNWPPLKKHITLFVVSVVSFMPDFVSSTGVVVLLPQVL